MTYNVDILSKRMELSTILLEKHQGAKPWAGCSEPLDELMLTILSQNTNDNLRDKAYNTMRERFPSWELVLKAPVEDIEDAIRIAGLSKQKAANIQSFLRWTLESFGELSLISLEKMNDDDVIKLLTSQKGVGIKTATVVLIITMGRDLCPVDTHVHRISKRLGWVDEKTTAEKTFWQLRPHVPKGKGHSLHMNLLQFGRTICQARKPRCEDCYLWDSCVWEGKRRENEH